MPDRTSRAFVNTFAGNPLDRAADGRVDERWLEASVDGPDAVAVVLWNGKPLVSAAPDALDGDGVRIAYLRAGEAKALEGRTDQMPFLGMLSGAPVFAVEVEASSDPAGGPLAGLGRFDELRAVALALPGPEAAIAGTAKSLLDWHRRHQFCAACGAATASAAGGWKRVCPRCAAEHFPRVDPVVIMLPVFGDRCLLGRQAAWPAGRMSALAGFVEPGESLEEACAREMREEAGLVAARVTYHSSQPWPFPSSLMVGFIAEVENDNAVPDGAEIEEVRWFTRGEARAVLDGRHAEVKPPTALGVARALLESWVEGYGA